MTASETAACFFDTSALIKRYHTERGAEVVEAAFAEPASVRIVSDIGIIELYSAFARRVRMGEITAEDFQMAKAELDADIQSRRLRVEASGDADKAAAARLIEQYGLSHNLRTLDALHLAVIQRLGPAYLRAVYCADRPLIALLEAEGFTVINPEASPEPAP
jgi:predicted nucleic acid-binding protein